MVTAMLRVMVLALALAVPGTALAIGGLESKTPNQTVDADYEKAVGLIWVEAYGEAIPLLQATLKRNPNDANAWNYLGFATRKLGDFEAAERHYGNALRLDPGHVEAMEYLGELYLETDRPAEAKALLARIAMLCPDGCEALDELTKAIELAENKQ